MEDSSPVLEPVSLPGDQDPEFEPIILNMVRRRSTDNLIQNHIDSDIEEGNSSEFGSVNSGGSEEESSEDDASEEDDVLTSEDELIIKQFPNSDLAKGLASKRKNTQNSKKGKRKKKGGKGKKKVGQGQNNTPR